MTDAVFIKLVEEMAALVKSQNQTIEKLVEKATVHPEKAASLHSRERTQEAHLGAEVQKESIRAAMPESVREAPDISEEGVVAETLEQAQQ